MRGRSGDMRTWAEVDLGAITRNLALIGAKHPDRALIAVIKADAYGHGLLPVARAVTAAGAAMVGVGDSREAMELVRAGLRAPVLILGAIIDGETAAVVAGGLHTTVHSMDRLFLIEEEARRQGRVHPVHVKVDTGMGRLGVMPERVHEVARRAHASSHLTLAGLSTHMANSHLDRVETTNRQMALFRRIVEDLRAEVGEIPWIHARNSAAAWNEAVEDGVTNAIRVGAALYGIPGPTERPYPFEPAMTLKTQVIFMKDVPAGAAVGYNGAWVAPSPTRLAVLPIGYADGIPPGAGAERHVLIRGLPAPVRGAVSMDYTTVDVTRIPGCATGDEVLVFGRSGEARLALADLAHASGVPNYAITCGIGRRIPRLYGEKPARERAAAT